MPDKQGRMIPITLCLHCD